jgi:hypothetical protein
MFDWANLLKMGAQPGAGGWATNVTTGTGQKGLDALMNPLARNAGGQVTGFSDPFMKTMGGAFQAAGGALPGGTPVTQTQDQAEPAAPQMARPQKMGAFSPSETQGPGPAAWLKSFGGQ